MGSSDAEIQGGTQGTSENVNPEERGTDRFPRGGRLGAVRGRPSTAGPLNQSRSIVTPPRRPGTAGERNVTPWSRHSTTTSVEMTTRPGTSSASRTEEAENFISAQSDLSTTEDTEGHIITRPFSGPPTEIGTQTDERESEAEEESNPQPEETSEGGDQTTNPPLEGDQPPEGAVNGGQPSEGNNNGGQPTPPPEGTTEGDQPVEGWEMVKEKLRSFWKWQPSVETQRGWWWSTLRKAKIPGIKDALAKEDTHVTLR